MQGPGFNLLICIIKKDRKEERRVKETITVCGFGDISEEHLL